MSHVFLSYSRADHFFAQLALLKLQETGVSVWVDQGQLRAGSDWRVAIDKGIAESFAVVLALSEDSARSSYVTYEWAYAIGKGKAVIPVRLNECEIHPKLVGIQYVDFSIPGHQPWSELVERIKEAERQGEASEGAGASQDSPEEDPVVSSILAYLNARGYQMVSFDRIRRQIDPGLTDQRLRALVKKHSGVFRLATLKGRKPGLARRF